MKLFRLRLITYFLFGGLLLHNYKVNAQSSYYTPPTATTDGISNQDAAIILVTAGAVGGIYALVKTIKKHSSPELRNFKNEVSNIDNLMSNKKEVIENRIKIHSSFTQAENYYHSALGDSRTNSTKLSERYQHYNNQKKAFSGYLEEYYKSQYDSYKNQFCDDITKLKTEDANSILSQNINPMIEQWKAFDWFFDYKNFKEAQSLEKILSNAKTIQKEKTETFDRLNVLVNY